MQFLILAHPDDLTACHVYSRLRDRYGSEETRIVSSEELMIAPHWIHRLEGTDVCTAIGLADGSWLRSGELRAVFNRIRYLAMPLVEGSTTANRSYAIMEMSALILSWLAGLPCPVINRPSPTGFGLQRRSLPEWLMLAARAGLPVQGYRFTSNPRRFPETSYRPHVRVHSLNNWDRPSFVEVADRMTPFLADTSLCDYFETVQGAPRSVLVIGDNVFGVPGSEYQAELRNLSRLAGCELLEVIFDQAMPTPLGRVEQLCWRVCRVNSFPVTQDPAAIDAIADLLASRSAS